jgi:hypothetical protein
MKANHKSPIELNLHVYGKIHNIKLPKIFDFKMLSNYFTLNNIKSHDSSLYANVLTLEKPFRNFIN